MISSLQSKATVRQKRREAELSGLSTSEDSRRGGRPLSLRRAGGGEKEEEGEVSTGRDTSRREREGVRKSQRIVKGK